MRLAAVLFSSALLLSPHAGAQAPLDLPPAADTYVDSNAPGTNYSSSQTLMLGRVYRSGAPNTFLRTYLSFDLASLSGRRIRRAELHLYQYQGHGAGMLPKDLALVTSAWSDQTMTWNSRAPFGRRILSFQAGDSFFHGWIVMDVTGQVQRWIDGLDPNFGFVAKHPSENQVGASRPADCRSREYYGAARRPFLRVSFYARPYGSACGSAPPTIAPQGDPVPASSFSVAIRGAQPLSPAVLYLGESDTSWGGLQLPFDLSSAGLPGCAILASWQVPRRRQTDAQGTASVIFTVPTDPALAGSSLFLQWLVASPGGTSPVQLSGGLQVEIPR